MKEVFTLHKADSLAYITCWLNCLVGSKFTDGTVRRVIDWQIIPTADYGQYCGVARIEVQE